MLVVMLSIGPALAFGQDGAMDTGFNPADLGVQVPFGAQNGNVTAISVQQDGKILIGGGFSAYNGSAADFLARLNTDGSLDAGFNASSAGLSADVKKMVVQSDGKILVSGGFGLKRILSNGTPDATFNAGGSGFNGAVNDFSVLQNGKIVVAGAFTSYNGSPANYLLRLNADGSRDPGFNSDNDGPNGTLNCVRALRDGKVVIAGDITLYNDIPLNFIARLNANGTVDETFVNTGELINSTVRAIALQADGKIYASAENQLIRFNVNGSIDLSFNVAAASSGIFEKINHLLIQPDGKLLVSFGESSYADPFDATPDQKLFRRNADGTNDNSFVYENQFAVEYIHSLAIQPDGKILLGQRFSPVLRTGGISSQVVGGMRSNGINRYSADGRFEDSFNVIPGVKGANRAVKAIAIQPDGKMLLGGLFFSYNGEPVNYLVRINPDGSRDYSFNAGQRGCNNSVYDVAVQPDGKIILAGVFTRYNGQSRNSLVRLHPDGSIDQSFNYIPLSSSSPDIINKVQLLPDGKILVGKSLFSPFFRLNADGSKDPTFTGEVAGQGFFDIPAVYSIGLQPDGKIIAGGYFSEANNSALIDNLARFLPDGRYDSTFNPNVPGYMSNVNGPDGNVYSIATLPDGKILIGGLFNNYQSFNQATSVGRLARLTGRGLVDTSFNRGGTGFDGAVYSVCVQPDGRILVGGNFSTYNGQPVNKFIRLKTDGSRDEGFNPGGSGSNGVVYTISRTASVSKWLIGGEFTSYNGSGKNRIARISSCARPPVTTTVNICSNQLPYTWNGNSYSAAGTYSISFSQPDGCDSVANLVLNVLPGGAGNITGPTRACPYRGIAGDTAIYTITAAQGSTITWSVSNAATMIITGGQSTNSVRIKYTDAFSSGVIYARVANTACGTPIRRSLSVGISLPATPSAITASTTNICPILDAAGYGNLIPVTYSIRKVATAASYNWTSQANSTFLVHPNGPGENDTIVQLYFIDSYLFSTSSITVQAVNDCGAGPVRSLTITRTIPATPGSITGPTNVCNFISPSGTAATYSVPPVVGMSYFWTIPDNAINVTGQNTNSVSFIYPPGFNSGTVSVVAINGCGVSAARTLTVRRLVAATPGSITAVAVGSCPDRTINYSIPAIPANASTLVWTVPPGAVILSGQGTTSILVGYSPAAVNGTVSVQAFNNCSSSSARSLSVKLSSCPTPLAFNGKMFDEGEKPAERMAVLDASLYPNPAPGDFSLMVTSGSDETVQVRLMDVSGKSLSLMNTIPGKILSFGAGLRPGVYLVEVRQGVQRKVLRGIKL